MCPAGSEHSVATQLFLPPISFTCDPVCPLWNIWRAGTDLVQCGQMARLEMALSSLEWLDPELDKDGLVVIIQETLVKDNVTPRCD